MEIRELIEQMMSAVASKDMDAATEAFQSIISQKIADRLESEKSSMDYFKEDVLDESRFTRRSKGNRKIAHGQRFSAGSSARKKTPTGLSTLRASPTKGRKTRNYSSESTARAVIAAMYPSVAKS